MQSYLQKYDLSRSRQKDRIGSSCLIIIGTMKQSQDDKLREQYLYRQLFESGIICYFCKLSEEMLRCDILMDSGPCNKHICVRCYKKHKNQPCEGGHKFEDHYFKDKKARLAHKTALYDEAHKAFFKENKVRSNENFKNLDPDLINLLAYLQMNPVSTINSDIRISYTILENNVLKLIGDKKKQERKLQSEGVKRKKAIYLSRMDNDAGITGIDSCGYNRKHQKGVNLILNAFSSYSKETQLPQPHRSEIHQASQIKLQQIAEHNMAALSLEQPSEKIAEGNSKKQLTNLIL